MTVPASERHTHGFHREGPSAIDWERMDQDAANVGATQGLGWHGVMDGHGRHRGDYNEETHR